MRVSATLLLAVGVLTSAGCATTGAPRDLTFADLESIDLNGQPSPLDLSRYFPDRAQRLETSGSAVVRCRVAPDRSLADCLVVSESPPEFGFGQATIRVARRHRVRADVVVVPEQMARLSIGWRVPN